MIVAGGALPTSHYPLTTGVLGVKVSADPHMGFDPAKASAPITLRGFRQTQVPIDHHARRAGQGTTNR